VPGAQHPARTAGQVKQDRSATGLTARPKVASFSLVKGLRDAVTALANGEPTRKINHFRQPLR
jgi:hypothetical protein